MFQAVNHQHLAGVEAPYEVLSFGLNLQLIRASAAGWAPITACDYG